MKLRTLFLPTPRPHMAGIKDRHKMKQLSQLSRKKNKYVRTNGPDPIMVNGKWLKIGKRHYCEVLKLILARAGSSRPWRWANSIPKIFTPGSEPIRKWCIWNNFKVINSKIEYLLLLLPRRSFITRTTKWFFFVFILKNRHFLNWYD